MRKSFKTALCTILGVCIIAAVLTGCSQAGDQRALDPNAAGNGMNNGIQNQGLNRNNLVGGRYGYDRNTGNNPSNYLSRNGINTINNNNRFSRMGNTGTGLANNGRTNSYTGLPNGNNRMMNTTGATDTTNGNDTARASRIERQLESMNGINDCTVVVSGNTALVGVRRNGTNTGNISTLKSSIERKVRQIDNSINKVVVTDSPDMLTRMGRLGTTVSNDGIISNFVQEFNEMIDSITNVGRQ
jgi:YhcN/YlaJ family sporulation lipoprotein